MKLKDSIEQLRIKFQQKNMIIVEGNVYDSFFTGEKKLKTIDEIIADIASEFDFKIATKFSPSEGLKFLIGEEEKESKNIDDENEFDDVVEKTNQKICLKDYMDRAVDEIRLSKNDKQISPKVYVIDFLDIFLDRNNQGMIQETSELLSAFLELNKIRSENAITDVASQNKIILLMRDAGNIRNEFVNKNIELATVKMLKPDLNERKKIISLFSSRFNVADNTHLSNDDSPELNEAAAITNGLNCKEILQLARIENIDSSFKELYNISQFGKKESEWEKLDKAKLSKINEELGKRVYGQDHAIDAIKKTIISSKIGLNGVMHSQNLTKPKGIMFFAGPTGTGKTELAKALATFVFGDERKMIRFDMSEYSQEHADQKLIGAPPGYVGYDGGGQLTNSVKENPFSILLFDEIEKAHPKILDKFLQILEDGRLTSSHGDIVDFSETFIIFTSNIGADGTSPKQSNEENGKKFVAAVEDHFKYKLGRPEILSRIGNKNIIPFNYIVSEELIKLIVKSKLSNVAKYIEKKHRIVININDDAYTDICEVCRSLYDNTRGGRGIVDVLENQFIDQLSNYIFENYDLPMESHVISTINVNVKGNKICFEKI